jgi:hypothetical protein
MRTYVLALTLAAAIASASHAQEPAQADHGVDLFNMIKLEVDYADAHDGLWNWNLDGWAGGDLERLWIRSEGEFADDDLETAELQLFYGRNFHPYWDALIGIRQDFEPDSETYLAGGDRLSLDGRRSVGTLRTELRSSDHTKADCRTPCRAERLRAGCSRARNWRRIQQRRGWPSTPLRNRPKIRTLRRSRLATRSRRDGFHQACKR